MTTTFQTSEAMISWAGCPPALCIVLVTRSNDELFTERSRSPARCIAMAGNPEVDLTDEAPFRAANHSGSPPITQRYTMLNYPNPKEGIALLIERSKEELEYL